MEGGNWQCKKKVGGTSLLVKFSNWRRNQYKNLNKEPWRRGGLYIIWTQVDIYGGGLRDAAAAGGGAWLGMYYRCNGIIQ